MNITAGIFKTHAQAEQAIHELHAFGVAEGDLSYVYANVDGDIVDGESNEKIGAGTASGLATGTLIGAVAGLAVAEGVLPGLGSLFVAGPLAALLGFTGAAATTVAGAATGAAAGGLIGALSNLGVSSVDATLYENLVRRGEVLVIARSESLVMRDIFIKAGATDVHEYIS